MVQSRIAIQLAHRMMAVLVFGHLLALACACCARPACAAGPSLLALLLLAQVSLGIANVKLALPLAVAVAHNAGAALAAVRAGLAAGAPARARRMSHAAPVRHGAIRQYWTLTKPRVVALIVFTALVGMFLAVPGLPPLRESVFGLLGIWLAAASAAAINHAARPAHRRADGAHARPAVADRRLNARQALLFALALGALSMTILVLLVNTLTRALTFASLIGYAVIYTGYLKRATPQNIVIGGIAGAAPPLLGWAAVTGMQLRPAHALLLVLIIFVWTPPHFWALAIFRRDDYARAMIPMLPVTHGVDYTRWQILLYTVLLLVATVLPWATGMSGLFYLGGALVLGVVFIWYAWRLLDPPDEFFAMRTFNYSIVYLMALFAFLLLDHWLLPWLQPVPGFELQPVA